MPSKAAAPVGKSQPKPISAKALAASTTTSRGSKSKRLHQTGMKILFNPDRDRFPF